MTNPHTTTRLLTAFSNEQVEVSTTVLNPKVRLQAWDVTGDGTEDDEDTRLVDLRLTALQARSLAAALLQAARTLDTAADKPAFGQWR